MARGDRLTRAGVEVFEQVRGDPDFGGGRCWVCHAKLLARAFCVRDSDQEDAVLLCVRCWGVVARFVRAFGSG